MIIFENRGKQYKAKAGDVLKLPRLSTLKKGDHFKVDKVIFYKNEKGESIIGSPIVKNVTVEAKVLEQVRDKKIVVFKKNRRKNYRRKIGHRQDLTLIKIEKINVGKSKSEEQTKNTSIKENNVKLKGEKDGS
ncbi:MAG: 50S ribosomal protein L21 [Alphaproteobacteria bacterium]